jgi:hypothetical protein
MIIVRLCLLYVTTEVKEFAVWVVRLVICRSVLCRCASTIAQLMLACSWLSGRPCRGNCDALRLSCSALIRYKTARKSCLRHCNLFVLHTFFAVRHLYHIVNSIIRGASLDQNPIAAYHIIAKTNSTV